MTSIDIRPKDRVNYFSALKEIAGSPVLTEKLLGNREIKPLDDPAYLIAFGTLKKLDSLQGDEAYIVRTITDYLTKSNVASDEEHIRTDLTAEYMRENAGVRLDTEIECYDLILDLLFNLQQAESEDLLKLPAGAIEAQLHEAERLHLAYKLDQAFPIFKALAEAGNGRAMYFVGEYYANGYYGKINEEEAKKITDAKWLAQGTIYPDRIESLSITGMVIKSHHNVGGLPKEMHLQLCEPLRWLFKDEVRRVGHEMGMPERLIKRHPFPGPGLAVRILGDITREKVRILQDADDIYIEKMHDYTLPDGSSLYDHVWQAGTVLLSTIRSVGVMGDERTYEHPVALRAVTSMDAMTADWAHLPYDFMADVSNEIIRKVKGVNRVCYDISSKPPSTIEWE